MITVGGNIPLADVQNVVDDINDIVDTTGIAFYLLGDITEFNNSVVTNNGEEYFETCTENHRVSNAMNMHFIIDDNDDWGGKANFHLL